MKSNSGEKRNQINLYNHSSKISMHSSTALGTCVTHLTNREGCFKMGHRVELQFLWSVVFRQQGRLASTMTDYFAVHTC